MSSANERMRAFRPSQWAPSGAYVDELDPETKEARMAAYAERATAGEPLFPSESEVHQVETGRK